MKIDLKKIHKNSRNLLDGKWTSERFAAEIISDALCSVEDIRIISCPIPMNNLKQILNKK